MNTFILACESSGSWPAALVISVTIICGTIFLLKVLK